MEQLKNINITISSGTIIKVILFALLFAMLFFLKSLVLIVLTAIVIASAIEPITEWFINHKIPRVVSVLLVYTIVILIFFSIFYFFVPPLLEEASNFLIFLSTYANVFDFSNFGGNFINDSESIIKTFSLQEGLLSIKDSFSNFSGGFVKLISVIFGGAFSLMLIIVFSFYFAVQETGIDDFLRVVVPVKHQKYILDLWKRSQFKIGRWMQGQMILALIVGVLVYIGLTILDVRYAFLLAVLAGIFELIPLFGAFLAAIPGIIIAGADGGVTLAIMVAGLYIIIQQFENHLIYPLVVTKVVGVPPLLVILALIVGAQFAGFLGIILSVPIAAIIQEFVKDIQKEKELSLKKHQQNTSIDSNG